MKIPKIKEDESLAMWRDRLAQEFNLDYKMQELLREVSITSYIHGTNVILDTLKKDKGDKDAANALNEFIDGIR